MPSVATKGLIIQDNETFIFKKENYLDYNNFVELKNTTKNKNVNLAQGTKTKDGNPPEEKFGAITFTEAVFADIEVLTGFDKTIQMELWQDSEDLQNAPIGSIFLAKNNNSKRYRNDYFFIEVTEAEEDVL